MNKGYLSFTEKLVRKPVSDYDLHMVKHDKSVMGEWNVYYESAEFILCISQDRGGFASIELGSKKRIKPGARMRGPWPMSHLRGYLEGSKDYYTFSNVESEALWLECNQNQLFDSELLNSDELNNWAIEASRRLFGEG